MVLAKIKTYGRYLIGLWKIYFIRRFKYLWKKYNILRSSPRRCLEYRIMPYFFAHEEFQNILLVGVSSCTEHYDEYYGGKTSVRSIDNDPEKARYGCRGGRHIVDSIEDIDRHFSENYFDVVFMNGVYGWGLNNEETLIKSLQNIRKVLKSGGILVFGWDKTPRYDPVDLDSKPYFSDFKEFELSGTPRINLDNKHRHTYQFFQKP